MKLPAFAMSSDSQIQEPLATVLTARASSAPALAQIAQKDAEIKRLQIELERANEKRNHDLDTLRKKVQALE